MPTDVTNEADRIPTQSIPAPETASADALMAQHVAHKPKRTLGLKLFDNFLYTFFTNTSVFLLSLGMTYMTKHGRTVGAEGSTWRGIGNWFAKRRKPVMDTLEKVGLKHEQTREDFTTVIFSFVDGTLFSLLVKPLEDRREKIAMKIDDVLGTTPDNMRAYDAEPKQSWRSVLEGRALTSTIVLPVAFAMEKTGGNQAIFYKTGERLAKFVKNSLPRVDNWLSKKTIHHKDYFFQTGVFEAFYTSVCTAGLYLISRRVARKHPAAEKHHTSSHYAPANAAHADEAETPDTTTEKREEPKPPQEKPESTVSQTAHLSKVAANDPLMEIRA